MTQRLDNFIAGRRMASRSGRTAPVFDPSTGEIRAEVGLSTPEEVAAAIEAAKEALPAWAGMRPLKRARIMERFRILLEDNREEIARLISVEHGKMFADALGEVARGIENVEYACAAPQLLKGEHSREVGPHIDSYTLRQPLGVCAGVTPFNFPVMVPLWMYPSALACGNTFVLKPSERDPSAPLFVMELAREAGVPDGVLNLVNGDREAVDTILRHPDVAAVSFVGSTPVAKSIYATAAAEGKRVQALGGAKNHMVIMPDADMDQATDALMGAVFGSAGERCMAISVAVPVGRETAAELRRRLETRIRRLKVGPWNDPGNEMGPLVTAEHLERVKGYIESGVEEGAELVVDGRGLTVPGHENGFFIGGTFFDHVTPRMRIWREEIFGPVLSMIRVENFEEAVSLINAHTFGNGTAIFTRDGDVAREFADRIEVGMVGINVPIPVPVAWHSFGGWKASLFGAHAIYGPDSFHFYTRLKTVTERWPTGIRSGAAFNFGGTGDH